MNDSVGFPVIDNFLSANADWAANLSQSQPDFLPTLAKAQAPPLVWIGCADSRVPESVILDQMPGQVFTTRNIANQFHDADIASAAVLEYALGHLNVSHVAVVGHTGCGGAKAAFDSPKPDAVTTTAGQKDDGKGKGNGGHEGGESEEKVEEPGLTAFLAPLIQLRHTLPSNATVDTLIVENVRATVNNVVNSTAVQNAWSASKKVCVHGWVYNLTSGLISDQGFTKCN